MIRSGNHSSFPKVGEQFIDQQIRTAERKLALRRIDVAERDRAVEEATTICVAHQARAFVEIVSDGMLGWVGPHEHLIDRTDGLERGPLVRWFETRVRVPIGMSVFLVARKPV